MNVSTLLDSTVFSAPIKLNTKLGPRLLKKASMTKLSWEIFFKDPKFFKANFEELGIKLQHLWPSNRGAELWWWSREDFSFHEIVSGESIENAQNIDCLYAKEQIKGNEDFDIIEKPAFCVLQFDKNISSLTPSWSSPSLRDLLSLLSFSEPEYSLSYKSKEVSTFWRREAVASKNFIDIYNKNVNQWRVEFSRHNFTFSNDGRVCWDNSTKIFPSIDEIELYYKDLEEGSDLFLDHTGINSFKLNEKLLNILNCKSRPFNFDFRISKIISENSCVLTGHVKHGYIEKGDSAFVLFNSQVINVKILDAVNVGVQIKKIYGGLFPEILVEHEIGHFPDRGVLMDKNALSGAPKWIEFSRRHKLAMESINHRNRQILHLKKELRRNLNLLINHGSPREFEVLIAELFEKMGGKCTLTPPSRDGGKDIIVELANIKYYVECKLFSRENKVGRPLIQKLAGVVATEKTKGLFVTTSSYTEGAIEYAAKAGIELWNFNKLAELMAEFYPNQNCNFPYTAICLECGALTEFNLLENKTSSICSSGHEVVRTISLEECCL